MGGKKPSTKTPAHLLADYCGGCGYALRPHPLAGRHYCCSPAYWSYARPAVQDVMGKRKMTGLGMEEQFVPSQQADLYLYHRLDDRPLVR